MTVFDFADETTDDTVQTTNDDDEVSPDFEANEAADCYLSLTDTLRTVQAIRSELGKDSPKLYSDDTLTDFDDRVEENTELGTDHPMQILELLYSLARSSIGKVQRENDHTIGLTDGKAPESHEASRSDVSYALYHNDLPTITTEGLDGGEREALQDMGIDPDTLGFDGSPQLITVNDQRFPIVVEEGDEISTAKSVIQNLPDEPSRYTEDGFVESSDPNVFDTDASDQTDGSTATDKADDGDDPSTIIENPALVGSFTVNEVKKVVTEIDSYRTIQKITRHESDGKCRSSLMSRLKQRRSVLEGSDDSDDDELDLSYDDLDDADKGVVSALMNSGQVETIEEGIEKINSL